MYQSHIPVGSFHSTLSWDLFGKKWQSLALAHVDIDDGKVVFVPWVETDFRTGDAPWWA